MIELKITKLISDLGEGLTRYKRDDIGLGSIEEKYGMTEKEVTVIFKHAALKNVETSPLRFKLIDDRDESLDLTSAKIEEVKEVIAKKTVATTKERKTATAPALTTEATSHPALRTPVNVGQKYEQSIGDDVKYVAGNPVDTDVDTLPAAAKEIKGPAPVIIEEIIITAPVPSPTIISDYPSPVTTTAVVKKYVPPADLVGLL